MPSRKFTLSPQQLHALHAGDRQILETIFDEFQPRLFRFLWLKLRDVQHAEDLVQETFFRFWKSRAQLRTESSVEIYLFRIAANLVTDHFRKPKAGATHVALEQVTLLSPQTPEAAVQFQQLSETIAAIVCQLPDGPRTAFSLSRFADLTYEEIAEVMGLSIKTVEKHLSKALHLLREKLDELGWRP